MISVFDELIFFFNRFEQHLHLRRLRFTIGILVAVSNDGNKKEKLIKLMAIGIRSKSSIVGQVNDQRIK